VLPRLLTLEIKIPHLTPVLGSAVEAEITRRRVMAYGGERKSFASAMPQCVKYCGNNPR
jgi:hypothetical protein